MIIKRLIQTIMAKKKFVLDIFFNIIATALPITILQLCIYPKVAKDIGGSEYGLMLSIYSAWMLIPNSMGNVLNNILLLFYPQYQKDGVGAAIAVLVRKWFVLSAVVVLFVIWFFCGEFTLFHILLGTLTACLVFFKAYLDVGFRINLNYLGILLNNTLLGTGFFLGYLLFLYTGIWELIFLTGYMFACIYCCYMTDLLKITPHKTWLHSIVKKDAYSLLISVIVNNLTNFADKLVLYPLMGGLTVSIYYTATILGKITALMTGPVNSVVLSYIARWDKDKADIFSKVLLIGIIISILGYIMALLLAKPVVGFLFPQWLDAVMDILPLTTATVMLTVLATILSPFVLKYCKMQWQVLINTVSAVIYFTSALGLWYLVGIRGFCIGTIIGVLVKVLLMIAVYITSIKTIN